MVSAQQGMLAVESAELDLQQKAVLAVQGLDGSQTWGPEVRPAAPVYPLAGPEGVLAVSDSPPFVG